MIIIFDESSFFSSLGCVRLENLDLDFQNLNPDFPIERTLSVIINLVVKQMDG